MENIEENLLAYFNGSLTNEENILVKQWSESNAKNNKLFAETKRVFDSTSVNDSTFVPDVDVAWKSVNSKIEKEPKVVKVDFSIFYKVAAVVLITLGIGYFSLSQFNSPKGLAIKTSNNQTKEILLPDGTSVSLNENSILKYPEFFEGDERIVYLKGQAFFDVKRDESATFRIKGENATVSVLGTAFDVISANGYSEVNVIRGSVKVASEIKGQSVVLIKNQRAIVKNNDVKSFESIDQNSLAWRSSSLDFESATLSQVSDILSDHFDVKVKVDENIKTCRITSKMSSMSLEEILSVLKLIANIESEVSEDQIVLSGPSC